MAAMCRIASLCPCSSDGCCDPGCVLPCWLLLCGAPALCSGVVPGVLVAGLLGYAEPVGFGVLDGAVVLPGLAVLLGADGL